MAASKLRGLANVSADQWKKLESVFEKSTTPVNLDFIKKNAWCSNSLGSVPQKPYSFVQVSFER